MRLGASKAGVGSGIEDAQRTKSWQLERRLCGGKTNAGSWP
jgi:hypothetical protein